VPEPIKVQARPKLSRRTENAAPRFASEEEEITVTLEPEELRAVPASVFDDEFFRSTMRSVAERETEAEAEASEREDDVSLPSASDYLQDRQDQREQEMRREQEAREAARALEAETRLRAELAAERATAAERETAYPVRAPETAQAEPESDELDIPAFLRRSSS
jgi:hypothetical protein